MKVSFCGICGTDLHATPEGLTTACCDQILGHLYVGEIVEVGKEADTSWKLEIEFVPCHLLVVGDVYPMLPDVSLSARTRKCLGSMTQGGLLRECIEMAPYGAKTIPVGVCK